MVVGILGGVNGRSIFVGEKFWFFDVVEGGVGMLKVFMFVVKFWLYMFVVYDRFLIVLKRFLLKLRLLVR